MKKSLALTIVLLSTPSFAGTDYSSCMEYLNPAQGLGGVGMGSSRLLGLPFTLKSDGSVNVREGVDMKVEENGKREIYSYEIPGGEFGGKKYDGFKYRSIVLRDDKGNLVSIQHGPEYTNSQLTKMHDEQIKMYMDSTPKEIIEANNKSMGGESQKYVPPFTAFKDSSVEFEVKNGKCVPMNLKQEVLSEPKVDGKTASMTQMDTKLCRDINEFLEANPEASACFKKDLNSRMSDIFKKHEQRFMQESMDLFSTFPRGMGGYGLGGYGGMGGFGMGFGMGYGMGFGLSLGNQVLAGNDVYGKMLSESDYFRNNRRMASSPILTGHKIVQNCFDSGLEGVVSDDSLWSQEQRASQDSIQASSEDTTAR